MSIVNLYTNIWTVTQTLVHTEHILSFISHYSMQTWAQTTQNMKSLITVLKCVFEHPSVMFCVALYLSIHADMFVFLCIWASKLPCFVILCIWTSNCHVLCSSVFEHPTARFCVPMTPPLRPQSATPQPPSHSALLSHPPHSTPPHWFATATPTGPSDVYTPHQLFAAKPRSSFMSMLSDNNCEECLQKDDQLRDQRTFIATLTQDVEYGRVEYEKPKTRKGNWIFKYNHICHNMLRSGQPFQAGLICWFNRFVELFLNKVL